MPAIDKYFFDPQALIPEAWRDMGDGAPFVFNNAIHRHGDALMMATRVATPEIKRIALCRLDPQFRPLPGSALPFSDHLTYADEGLVPPGNHERPADPRFVSLGDRLFLHFNSGSRPLPNRIYMAELDPATLLPLGPARELVRAGPRRDIEKNWMLFAHAGALYAIYSFAPLVIMRVSLADPARILCEDAFVHHWDAEGYEHTYGELRGGTPPVRRGDRLVMVLHSAFETRRERSPGAPESLHYVAPVIALRAEPPFAPLSLSAHPVLEVSRADALLAVRPRLDGRVREDVYPTGAVADGDALVVSYGMHNQCAVLQRLPFASLEAAMLPALVKPRVPAMLAVTPPAGSEPLPTPAELAGFELRTFWWLGVTTSRRDPALEQNRIRGQFAYGNFGDMTAKHLLNRVVGLPLRHLADEGPRLLTVGSIIQTAREGDVIWGSGCNGARAFLRNAPTLLHAYATRGPISLEFLRRRGFDTSRVSQMFDPASLLPHVFAPEIAAMRAAAAEQPREGILIVPHYRDQMAMRRAYPEHLSRIQSPDCGLFDMMARMLRCELVVSSSLHGLIVAEALGIPAIWHRPLMGEDELKFTDYYLGTDRWQILRVESLAEAIRATPMALPVLDGPAMLATFPPVPALKAHGVLVRPDPAPLDQPFPATSPEGTRLRLLGGWAAARPDGTWTDGAVSRFSLSLGDLALEGLELVLTLRPMLPGEGRPQTLRLRTGEQELGSFRLTDPGMQTLRVPLRQAETTGGQLVLTCDIGAPTSPAQRGPGRTTRRYGIFLSSVMLTRGASQG